MQKISIKREQSQAGLSFAERENRRSLAGGESNFRPQVKNKLLLLLALLMTAATGAWAQEVIPETLDFTSNSWGIPSGSEEKTADENSYTSGGYTITLCGSSGNGYYFSPTEPYILLGKQGAYLQLPAFSSAVDSIKVVGSPNATTAVEQNIYVGDVAVSTATTGMKNVTQKYVIAENYRTAGTIYRIKVTSAHNTQIKKVLVYFTPASGYSVTMKDGTEDATSWQGKAGEGEYQTLPLEGVAAGTAVTATYNGTKKVKSVKAVKKGAAEPAAIINGKFSVSDTKQVYFSKGNLRYVSGAWSFFDNQYDYYTTYSADALDKFGWSNSTNNFGMSTSTNNNDYKNDLVDWGTVPGIGSGWRTLTLAEWQYLFSTRSASTVNSVANARYAKGKVNNVYGIILFPDTYTHPDGVTNPVGINDTGNTGWNGNNYNATDWGKMEAAGCVFLPAAGYRQGTSVQSAGSSCSYRSSTRYSATLVQYIYFESSLLNLETHNNGFYGQCVRLVREVAE